jgi:DNA-binding response OmpR family regulator
MARILIVEDNRNLAHGLRTNLEYEGHAADVAADGVSGLSLARARRHDLLLLDLMLPGLDGVEVCRQLRSFSDVYVIMLTARGEEIDRVVGLSVGADDYLVKPFSPRELVARIKALLRRPRMPATSTKTQVVGDLNVDVARRKATVAGRDLGLTAVEFDLLATLGRDPGVVVTRQGLLDQVWGADYFGDDHVLDVHVAKLRRKLAADGAGTDLIETIRGIGFRLKEPS